MGQLRIISEKFVDVADRFSCPRIIYELEARILPNNTDPEHALFMYGRDTFRDSEEVHKAIMNAVHGRLVTCDIKKVIFNPPATIVLWEDGTKTVVKTQDDDEFVYDPEKGLAMAIAKKALGNKGNYYNAFTKWLSKEEENNETGV